MENVTGEQVKAAMIASDIQRVDSHECSLCGVMVYYFRVDDQLFFNSSCGCAQSTPRKRRWSDAAEWINMQTHDEVRAGIMAQFGFVLATPVKE